jgi:predicted Zn-dependent protease
MSRLIGQTRLLRALGAVVKRARSQSISVCAQGGVRQVFRFAKLSIHQDVLQEQLTITVTVADRKRIGIASTDSLVPASLQRCLRAAQDIAAHAPESDLAQAWPKASRIRFVEDYDAPTAALPPKTCVDLLQSQFHRCQGLDIDLAGSLANGADELAVVSSEGISSYSAASIAAIKLVTFRGSLSGYASSTSRTFSALDIDQSLKRAVEPCLHKKEAIRLPLGSYPVILGPEAVADLLDWLGIIAFGAKAFQERSSFLAGRMDEQVMDPQISIYDNAMEPGTLRMPFDYEGTPKQRVTLIENGRACGIVYDSAYGGRFGQSSTGHALPPGETEGPLPQHLSIAPGQADADELIRSCKRGLLIPRLHYVNGLLNPREALMTGLTREGAFLIENGKLTTPLSTMRFTHSILDAFSHVVAISRQRRLVADPHTGSGCALVPWLHLEKLQFTGRSE